MTDSSNGNGALTTSRGVHVKFLSIAPLLDKLEAWRVSNTPKPPTYTPQVAEGMVAVPEPHYHRVVETKTIDPETQQEVVVKEVQTSLETPEEWAAWETYEAALNAVQREYAKRFARTVLLRGVQADMPADEGWIREQEFMGYTVPADPFERRWYWLETEMASTVTEYEQIVVGVLRASGSNEEVISAMEETFRGTVGQS